MRPFLLFALGGTAISALSLFGFILVSRTLDPQLRYAFVLFYIFATFFLLASHQISKNRLIALACATALSSICVEQIVGFYLFPGLVKDISAFSGNYIIRLGMGLCVAFLWYLVIAITAKAVTTKSPETT